MPDVILDPFHRTLNAAIETRLEDLKEKLCHGAATRVTEDTVSVSEKYAALVAQIRELEVVQAMCRQIEVEQNTIQPRVAKTTVRER